jgi:PhzF family phenazine biosynthesis protein
MRTRLFQVDAFADRLFAGNPAAVVPLDRWLDDATLLAIARENNLSETAFFVPEADRFRLRWFTPEVEVDLCGHATLAAAFVLLSRLEPGLEVARFSSKSGELSVRRDGDRLVLDFPSRPPAPCSVPEGLYEAIGRVPVAIAKGLRDHLLVFDREDDVRSLSPDFARLSRVDHEAVIATAPGTDVDFVSRFFAPRCGIDEDPVTGSAHCTLAPYWATRLGKPRLTARQLSRRGGELTCEVDGDRVLIGGRAVLYLEGFVELGQIE